MTSISFIALSQDSTVILCCIQLNYADHQNKMSSINCDLDKLKQDNPKAWHEVNVFDKN